MPAGELPPSASPTAGARCGLLLTPADLTPEVSRLGSWPVSSVAAGWDREVGELLELDPEVVAFKRLALADGLARARQHFACPGLELDPVLDWVEAVRRWAAEAELEEVLTLEAPVGPWRAALERLAPALAEDGRRLVRVRRDWDDALWPRATRGFFAFKRDLEATVLELCRGGSSREGA